MHRHGELLLILAAASLPLAHCAVAVPAAPAALAAPRIEDYSFSGSGCSGTDAVVSAAGSTLTVSMPAFAAHTGGEAGDGSFMAGCTGIFDMRDGITGYRLAIRSVEYKGYLLTRGAGEVEVQTATRVLWGTGSGQRDLELPEPASSVFKGGPGGAPTLAPFERRVEVPESFASGCTQEDLPFGLLNIGWRIVLTARGNDSYGAFLGMEGSPVTGVIEFEWVKCDVSAVEIEVSQDE